MWRVRFEQIPGQLSMMLCGRACPKSALSDASTLARVAQKADCTLKSGLFGQRGGGVENNLQVLSENVVVHKESFTNLKITASGDFHSHSFIE